MEHFDEEPGPADIPVIEAGGGVAEGFELAEAQLIEAASHGDDAGDPMDHAYESATPAEPGVYGEADEVESTEVVRDPTAGPDDPGEGPGLSAER
jgi:hypothetical protein